MSDRDRDRLHLARCLALADRHRGRTAPNPLVGCVVCDRRGRVIAEGAHAGPGKHHAEIAALRKIGGSAPGGTLYVNLEPCNHHGRTPPCAPIVRDSGVARVVIGMPDPITGHGGGIEVLRRAGISVSVGVLRAEVERHNLGWLTYARLGRPAFTLKAAITLDGKICTVTGQSKWITGEAARTDVMRQRDHHDAVLVGVGTVLADDPWLTARIPRGRDPIRIVVDSTLRTPPSAHLLPKRRGPRTVIACTAAAPARRERALAAAGAEIWRLRAHRNGRVDLVELARRLGATDITSVLVEGGGEIHAELLRERLADQVVVYVAPKLVGGPARSWVGGAGLASLGAAHQLVFDEDVEHLGDDLRLTGRIREPG